jgi:hypothetical protein
MPTYSPTTLSAHLAACSSAKTRSAKGKALEELCRYVFEQIPDVIFLDKNILDDRKAHELDLAFMNRCVDLWPSLGSPLILECKNHARPIGSAHIAWFATKLRSRASTAGVLVSLSGVTGVGDAKSGVQQVVDSLGADGVRILILNEADIKSLTSTDDLIKLLLDKFHKLVLNRRVV